MICTQNDIFSISVLAVLFSSHDEQSVTLTFTLPHNAGMVLLLISSALCIVTVRLNLTSASLIV